MVFHWSKWLTEQVLYGTETTVQDMIHRAGASVEPSESTFVVKRNDTPVLKVTIEVLTVLRRIDEL